MSRGKEELTLGVAVVKELTNIPRLRATCKHHEFF